MFTLDASIGLTQGSAYLLRELYPCMGRLSGKPGAGLWHFGDKVSLAIKGPEARVLELVPAGKIARPALLHATGKATLNGESLVLTDVLGETGRPTELAVLLPTGRKVSKVTVNGREFTKFQSNIDVLDLSVTFAGTRFEHCQQIGAYDRNFADKVFRADLTVPKQVFEQLAARRKAWPVDYTKEELLATWRGSDRLLLHLQIADPKDGWTVGLKIDGQTVEVKKAYGNVFPSGGERTFSGFYADLSKLQPDTPHNVEVELPAGLRPGQFQGLFLENVETEFTSELAK